MKNCFVVCVAILLTASSPWQPASAQEGVECILAAVAEAEQGIFERAECEILNHRLLAIYDEPSLSVSVTGPVVNTSRTFIIPRRGGSLNFKPADGGLAMVVPAQGEKTLAIAWIKSIYEQIVSGLSLSAVAPSTNAALNSALRTFDAVVMPKVSPQARAAEEGKRTGEARVKPGEISTDVEYETFTFVGQDGKSLAFRGAFERTTDAGGLGFGLRLAYNRVTFDKNDNKLQTGEATAFVKIPLADFFEIGGNISGTFNRLKTGSLEQNVNSLGYGPFLAVRYNFPAGHMLAGGVMYQIINPDEELEPDKENLRVLAYGAMAVLAIGEKLAVSAEGFSVKNLEIEGEGDSFAVLHPQIHFYLSDSFGLVFGYKTVLGIDDYDSTEFTLGSSVRF